MNATNSTRANGPVSRVFRALQDLLGAAIRGSASVLCTIARTCERWLLDAKRAQYGIAVARILLGVTIAGFVLSNLPTALYTFGPGAAWTGQLEYPTSDFAKIFPFSIVNQAAHTDAGILTVMIALLICAILFAVGYRTRIVMIPLFILWIGLLSINTYVQDQSDNLTRMSLLYLFFTGLGDRWSFDAARRKKHARTTGPALVRLWRYQRAAPTWLTNLLHNLAVIVVIAQLCFVYASGGLFKAGGLPWQNGTAVYDPLQTERFGTWPILSDLVSVWGPGVAIATIATVLVQATFPLLMVHRFTRILGLMIILFFHIGIAVLMGLPWFSLSMIALDAVFITDKSWKRLHRRIVRAWTRTRSPDAEPAVSGAVRGAQDTDEPTEPSKSEQRLRSRELHPAGSAR